MRYGSGVWPIPSRRRREVGREEEGVRKRSISRSYAMKKARHGL